MNEIRAKIDRNGRLIIPSAWRKAMGVQDGDDVLLRFDGEELRVASQSASVKRAQQIVRQYVSADQSLVDDLLQERRADAARE